MIRQRAFVLQLCFLLISLVSLPSTLLAAPRTVVLTVKEPAGVARTRWPVTSGVPLPRGAITTTRQCELLDGRGKRLPLQTEILSRWDDGSVRWLLLDFQVSLRASQTGRYRLRFGKEIVRPFSTAPALITNRPSHAEPITPIIQTGPLKVNLWSEKFHLLDRVWLDQNGNGQFESDERLTNDKSSGFVLTDANGKKFRADLGLPTWKIEQHGPLRTCVRFTGRHVAQDGTSKYRYVIRIHAYRGLPHLKVDYTFINDDPSTLMSQIQSIDFYCSTTRKSRSLVLNGQATTKPSRLFQVDDRWLQVNNQKPVKGHGAGWIAAGNESAGMAIGVQEFWQNWPKSLSVDEGNLQVGLLPDFPAGQYDGKPLRDEVKRYYYLRKGVYTFKIGVARTHRMWVTFFRGRPHAQRLSQTFAATEKPLVAQCSPEYIQATQAISGFVPAARKKSAKRYYGFDEFYQRLFDRHLRDQQKNQEYGLLNFGDWYDEDKFAGGWGNQEYDTSFCFFTQYLRTGDRRYFDRARQGAGHMMDVDVVHAINRHIRGLDGHGRPHPGHMWTHSVGHTGGYYQTTKLKAAPWYQRGMLQNTGHIWIGGLSSNYLLTGNRRALEVLRLVADRVASEHLDGYSDHIRGMGWPLNLLMTAYELTRDPKYLEAAHRQWRLLKRKLDLKRGWVIMLAYGHCNLRPTNKRCHGNVSYMLGLTLSALAKYYDVTKDPEIVQAIRIGLDQIINECWDKNSLAFHATACRHHIANKHPGNCYPTVLLAAPAFRLSIEKTGDKRHKKIYRQGFQVAVRQGINLIEQNDSFAQAGYMSRWLHFTPFGLSALED